MSENKSEPNVSISLRGNVITTIESPHTICLRRRIYQNFIVIWVDDDIDESDEDCQRTLAQLRSVVNDVNIFTKRDECIDFLTESKDIKVFLIIGDTLGQQLVPIIHNIPQLDIIYILCHKKVENEKWTKQWPKVNGIHVETTSICASLQETAKQCNQDSVPMSFITFDELTSFQNLNQLEPSFMYTQIFKEILLDLEYDQRSVSDFSIYCRNNNYGSTTNIDRFEKEYYTKSAIWWYTFPSFIYSMLNGALRMMEAETIIKMGFFIHHLHHQIEQLHRTQIVNHREKSFIVYRGQGLSEKDFEKLQKTKGGLVSFNNFLSTSKDEDFSLEFAKVAVTKTDTIGILFKMTIDRSISSTPFASVQDIGYFQEEQEILFSMHTVFRVSEIIKIDDNNPLYKVELKLTPDDDEQLHILAKYMRDEAPREIGWERMGILLIKIGQFDKAEELYNALLEKTSDETKNAHYYNKLAIVKMKQAEYQKSIWYNEKALEILKRTLSSNHPRSAALYDNIGQVYQMMGEHSKALLYHEKALEIYEKTVPPNDSWLATAYSNVGAVSHHMGEYSKALSFYEKALEIYQNILPANHPHLSTSYSNIAAVYNSMGEHLKTISFFKKALEVGEKTLPPDHPDLAISYINIGVVYTDIGKYSKALSFFEKGRQVFEKTSLNHPQLATCYSHIGTAHRNMGEHSKALLFFQKGLDIRQKTLATNHPDLANSYNSIGLMYNDMGEYSKALSFFQKALNIRQKALAPNHPDMASSYNNIGSVYDTIGEYSKALSFHEKASEIYRKTLALDHPDLASSDNNMGLVFQNMGEHSKALSFFEKALEVREKTLPPNHPNLASSYISIGAAYQNMGEHSKAVLFYEKGLAIFEKILPPNHVHLATCYNNIGTVLVNSGDHSKALLFLKKGLEICEKTLDQKHPSLAIGYNNIAALHQSMGEHAKAVLFYERGLEIFEKTLPLKHPHLATSYCNIAYVYYSIKQYSKALSSFKQASGILQSALPSNHPDIKIIENNIELLKRIL